MKTSQSSQTSSTELLLAEVTDEFLARMDRGERPEVEEYAKRYPELAPLIRQVLPALQIIQNTAASPKLTEGKHAGDPRGQLGDYRIIREIGRGGMGVVYEAEQVSLGRKVALKMLPFAAVLDQRQLQRFKNEAQAAAQLHHTNIVPVHSIGCERGVHYYAMQYIEGQTLAAVIRELRHVSGLNGVDELPCLVSEQTQSLAAGRWAPAPAGSSQITLEATPPSGEGSSAAVQELASEYSTRSPAYFRSVCHLGIQVAEALDHAHQSGVFHRDIKPSNLLLDTGGHVWITDFGLAQMESDPGLTMTGDILGTVRYMSPEQALAKRIPIDHRTDIYSLGVTLYELLTLQPAFTGRDRQELLRQIAFEEPRQPRRVNSAIPTELETIVLKAVSKNPQERYATAQELADDLTRYLEDKPIRAKRPTLVQRATKWSRRHRAVVASGVVLLVMAVIALSVSTVLIWQEQARTTEALTQARDNFQSAEAQRRRAEKQQLRAEANFQKARDAVDKMLTEAAEKLADVPHMEQVRRSLLADAIEFYQGFLEERSDDPDVRSEAGRAYRRVGAINQLLGQNEQAEESYKQAVATFEQLVDEFPDKPDHQKELAMTCTRLGKLLRYGGRAQEGEAPCRRALTIWEELLAEFPDRPEYRSQRGSSHYALGVVLFDTDRREEAEQVLRQGMAVFEQLSADFPSEPEYRSGLALIQNALGWVFDNTDRKKDAEAAFRRAVELQQKLVDDFPAKREYRDSMGLYLRNLGGVLRGADQSQEAEELYPRALALQEKLASDFPSVPGYWDRLVATQKSLAGFLTDQKQLDEAEKFYRQALERQQKRVAENPNKPDYQWQPTYTLRSLLSVLVDAGKIDEAKEEFQQALQRQEKLISDHPEAPEYREQLASLYFGFAYALHDVGRNEQAEQSYRQGLAIFENFDKLNVSGTESRHPTLAFWAHNNLGVLLKDTGRTEHAEVEYRRAVEVGEKLAAEFPEKPGYRDALVRYPLRNLGMVLFSTGQLEEGHDVYRRALVLAENLVSDDPKKLDYREHLALTHRWFADGLRDAGRMEEALDVYRQIVVVRERLSADFPDKPDYRQGLNHALREMASWLAGARKMDEAMAMFQQAVQKQEELIAEYPEKLDYQERLATMHRAFADSLRDAGRHDEAEAHYKQVQDVGDSLIAAAPDEPRYRRQQAWDCRVLGDLYAAAGRLADAESAYRTAVSIADQTLIQLAPQGEEYHQSHADKYAKLVGLLTKVGRLEEAEQLREQSLGLMQQLASEHPEPQFRKWLARECREVATWHKSSGAHARAEELLRRGLAILHTLLAEYPDGVDFIEELQLTYVLLSDLLRTTDRAEQADEMLAKARALWERLPDLTGEREQRDVLWRVHRDLGKLLSDIGRHEEALSVFRQAVTALEALRAVDPSVSWNDLGLSYRQLADELQLVEKMDDAKEALRSAIDVYARAVADFLGNSGPPGELHTSYSLLGDLFSAMGNSQDLKHAVSQEIEVQQARVAKLPKTSAGGKELAWYYRKLAGQMREAGHLQQAEQLLRAAIDVHTESAADFPDDPKQRDLLCYTYRVLGETLKDENRLDEAEVAYGQAIEVQEALLAEYPDSVDFIEELQLTYVLLSDLLRTTDRVKQASEMLAKARALWERLPELTGDREQRDLLWQAHRDLGKLLSDIGRHEEALMAFRQAVTVLQALTTRYPSADYVRNNLGLSYRQLADELQFAGRMDDAKEALRSAIDVYARAVADFPDNGGLPGGLHTSYSLLGDVFSSMGNSRDLKYAVSQEIEVQQARVAKLPKTSPGGKELAWYYRKLAGQMRNAGHLQQAEQLLRAAIDVHTRFAADFPDDPKQRDLLCYTYRKLGELLKAGGDLDEAEVAYRQAIEVQEALLAEYPDSVDFIEELEEVYVLLSDLLRTIDRAEQADEMLVKARALWERLPDLTGRPEDRVILFRSHAQLGELLCGIGRYEEALMVFRQGVAVQEALHASYPSASLNDLGLSYRFLGRELQRAGRMDEAEDAFHSAIDVYGKLVADSPGNSILRGELRTCFQLLRGLFSEMGNLQGAERALRSEIEVREKLLAPFSKGPEDRVALADLYLVLGDLLADTNRSDEAADIYRRVVDMRERLVADDPGNVLNFMHIHAAYMRLASTLRKVGRLEDAETVYRRASEQYESLDPDLADNSLCRTQLADNFQRLGQAFKEIDLLPEAEEAYGHGIGIRQKLAADLPAVPGYRLKLASDYTGLAGFLVEVDRCNEAAEVDRKAVAVLEKLAEETPDAPVYRTRLEASYRHLGDALKRIGRVQEAERAYQRALELQAELADSGMALPGHEALSATAFDHWCPVSNFDGAVVGGGMIFQPPRFSGNTAQHLTPSIDLAIVTDEVPAFDGNSACKVQWQWPDSDAGRWLRLTTCKRGNPTIDLRMPVRVRLRLDEGSLRVCLGIRETGVDVPFGIDGGQKGTIEWVGAESVIEDAPQGILVTAKPGVWQTLTFVPGPENVWPMTGDGVLHAANNKGVFEHLAFTAVDDAGPFTVYIDAIEQACPPADTAEDADREGGDHDNDGHDGKTTDEEG